MSRLLVIVLISLFSKIGLAAEPDLHKIVQSYTETKQKLIEAEVKQRKVMSSLFEVNRKMKKIVEERSGLVQQKFSLESTTKELALQIVEMEVKVKILKNRIRNRLIAIYRLGDMGLAQILMTAQNSAQLERSLKVLGLVATRDLSLVQDLRESILSLKTKKQKFVAKLSKLRRLEGKIANREGVLSKETELKSKILDDIKKSQQFASLRLRALREKTKAIAGSEESDAWDLILKPPFFEQKGLLSTPAEGKVLQGFGVLKDRGHKVSFAHKGVFLGTKIGTPVRSIFAGRLQYYGQIDGFGKTAIIDHGDHYYSIYSHLEELAIKLGEPVRRDQTIARSGNSSVQFGEGIYFEIRHFSEPYDPKVWVKGL